MKKIGSKGGQATKAKLASPGFDPEAVPPLETLEDAKAALDSIRRGVLCRTITHAEANAASKAVAEWVKTETATTTQRLVTELHRELEAKETQIAALRKQLSGGRGVRAVQ
jgi:hypothetical protein